MPNNKNFGPRNILRIICYVLNNQENSLPIIKKMLKERKSEIEQLSDRIASGDYNTEAIYNQENVINLAITLKNKLSGLPRSKQGQLLNNKRLFGEYLDETARNMPIAQKKIKNDTILQRRMDSLARVLSVPATLTPCIAVACIADKLYLTANTPSDPAIFETEVLNKWNALKDFIRAFQPDESYALINRKAAIDTAQKLAFDPLERRWLTGMFRLGKYNTVQRLQMDLLKIADFYHSKEGKDRFSEQQKEGLRQEAPIFILPTNTVIAIDSAKTFAQTEQETGLNLHAEQLMFLKIKRMIESGTITKEQCPIFMGINKLACATCDIVLDPFPNTVQYRGISDLKFNKTVDLLRGKEDTVSIFKLGDPSTHYPEDSDSGSEYEINWHKEQARSKNRAVSSSTTFCGQLSQLSIKHKNQSTARQNSNTKPKALYKK